MDLTCSKTCSDTEVRLGAHKSPFPVLTRHADPVASKMDNGMTQFLLSVMVPFCVMSLQHDGVPRHVSLSLTESFSTATSIILPDLMLGANIFWGHMVVK